MKNFDMLTEINFELFVKLNYNNPSCASVDEFNDDMKRVKYIKRLFLKYDSEKQLKTRLLKNHILVLNNVFGLESTARILFFKIEKKYHGFIKAFLTDLDLLPKSIPEVDLELIPADPRIQRLLKKND